MSSAEVAVKTKSVDVNQVMEKVLLAGDLAKMEPRDRVTYYLQTCESLGMNPMTKPFDLITLNGKMVLYVNRSGTDQLRKIGNVGIQIIDKGFDKDTGCYVVTARAKLPCGRDDEDMGVVYTVGLKGDPLANAQLKAMTKAKRRVTLSIMGLGWLDESEVSSIKGAKLHKLDLESGAVIDVAPQDKPKEIEIQPEDPMNQLFLMATARSVSTPGQLKALILKEFPTLEVYPEEFDDLCAKLKANASKTVIKPLVKPKDPLPWAKYLE
jgi:hypothetical protein